MSEHSKHNHLIGLSLDMPSSPKLKIKHVAGLAPADQGVNGWGLAWYPPDDRACAVLKDPTAEPADPLTRVLGDWQRFRSTVFVCHLRGLALRVAQEDTQPFERSHAGRSVVIAHNGRLRHGYRQGLPLADPPLHEPIGHTDTEYFLCWLLHRMHEGRYRSLKDAGWPRLHDWLRQINQFGTLNLLLTDGDHLLAYQDAGGFNRLSWTRNATSTKRKRFENSAARIDLGGPRDANRTSLIVATHPMSSEDWQPLSDGELLVLSRGAVVWSSSTTVMSPNPQERPSVPAVDSPTPPIDRMTEPYALSVEPAALGQTAAATGGGATVPQGGRRVYRIEHTTRYLYSSAVESSTHIFRLKPVHDSRQRVITFDLNVTPDGQAVEFEDVFGNHVRRQRLSNPYSELNVASASTVELLTDTQGPLRSAWRRSTIPLVWMPWQRQMMMPYLLPPELPETQLQELFDYAMSFVERQDYDLIESLTDLNRTIYQDYAYVQGVTSVATTPFEVFSSRRGVCQDFANLFICVARLLGIPARYRMGYIFTGAQYENKLQSDASHAWVEVYLPWTGWRGFDPTNGSLVNGDHIRVACGRNYHDATPTAGTLYRGGGRESLTIDVRITPIDPATGPAGG